mmetsp:Transcript_30697/g.60415  ORF Transcript_30697/g.60415 Transcript_30697/m.60415 type:complete len:276 (-) Transcript_30697:1061-1888(-)
MTPMHPLLLTPQNTSRQAERTHQSHQTTRGILQSRNLSQPGAWFRPLLPSFIPSFHPLCSFVCFLSGLPFIESISHSFIGTFSQILKKDRLEQSGSQSTSLPPLTIRDAIHKSFRHSFTPSVSQLEGRDECDIDEDIENVTSRGMGENARFLQITQKKRKHGAERGRKEKEGVQRAADQEGGRQQEASKQISSPTHSLTPTHSYRQCFLHKHHPAIAALITPMHREREGETVTRYTFSLSVIVLHSRIEIYSLHERRLYKPPSFTTTTPGVPTTY